MGKKHKGKLCAYCGVAKSTSPDHVFAREFFLREHRANLPQVPACGDCNHAKAKLEHHLTAVLPFGGRHDAAAKNLSEMVPKRLAKNVKLHRGLRDKMSRMWDEERGIFRPVSAFSINAESLIQLFEYIVRGLAAFHWGVVLGPRCSPRVMALTDACEKYFDELFAMTAAARVREDVGNGTFIYEGAQGVDIPEISVWRFQVYGGVRFADPDLPGVVSQRFGALTKPTEAESSGESPPA